jgi:hypothetical protein
MLRCPAFGEKQIQEDIQHNLRDRHYPYLGDHNVRFEKSAMSLSMSDSFIQTTKKVAGVLNSDSQCTVLDALCIVLIKFFFLLKASSAILVTVL